MTQKIKCFNRILRGFLAIIISEVKKMINDSEMLNYILQSAEMHATEKYTARPAICSGTWARMFTM